MPPRATAGTSAGAPGLAAGAVIAAVPTTMVLFAFQLRFVSGHLVGAIK